MKCFFGISFACSAFSMLRQRSTYWIEAYTVRNVIWKIFPSLKTFFFNVFHKTTKKKQSILCINPIRSLKWQFYSERKQNSHFILLDEKAWYHKKAISSARLVIMHSLSSLISLSSSRLNRSLFLSIVCNFAREIVWRKTKIYRIKWVLLGKTNSNHMRITNKWVWSVCCIYIWINSIEYKPTTTKTITSRWRSNECSMLINWW